VEDDSEPFEQKMKRLTETLEKQFVESAFAGPSARQRDALK